MDNTSDAQSIGVEVGTGAAVPYSSDTVTPSIAIAQPVTPDTSQAESVSDIPQETLDRIFADLTAYPNGRELQASYDKQIAELKAENRALKERKSISNEVRELSIDEAIATFGDDQAGLVEYLRAKERNAEELARAERLKAEERELRQQEVQSVIAHANTLLKSANMDWGHPLVMAFKKKFPVPTERSLVYLSSAIIKWQREETTRVKQSVPAIVSDARAKTLQSSGVARVASGAAKPSNMQEQLRRAVLAGDLESYRKLKAQM